MAVRDHLPQVLEGIRAAEAAAGRPAHSVRLLAVSKTKPASAVEEAHAAGQVDFGENRVQEMAEKHAQLAHLPLRWHQIGHLQTNKVKYLAPFVHLIHSLDSVKLLAEIDRQAARHNRVIDCLIQVNISNEDQKEGTDEAGVQDILAALPQHPNVRIRGLMGIAELTDNRARIAAQFQALAALRERLRAQEDAQVSMEELSMGMSADYDLAIAAGATMVRVGSAIFGAR